MKRIAILVTVTVIGLATAVPGFAERGKGKNRSTKAIRQVAAAFMAAFNEGNAQALAALWAPAGDYIGPRGELITGREEIEKRFRSFFSLNEQVRLDIHITAIRFVGDDVAVVDGTPEVTPPLQGPPVEVRSTIILLKRDGRWLIESARETLTNTPSNYDHLKGLQWMIGDWTDAEPASDGMSIESTCDWTVNKNFLIRRFTAEVKDQVSAAGTQLIGWDPRSNTIRSWTFDSSGDFVDGVWRRDGKRWIVETSGVLQDGSEVSSTNTLTRTGDDTFTFRSANRVVNGQREPDIGPVQIKRQPLPGGESDGAGSRKQPSRKTVLPP